jgi:hypothetical protein
MEKISIHPIICSYCHRPWPDGCTCGAEDYQISREFTHGGETVKSILEAALEVSEEIEVQVASMILSDNDGSAGALLVMRAEIIRQLIDAVRGAVDFGEVDQGLIKEIDYLSFEAGDTLDRRRSDTSFTMRNFLYTGRMSSQRVNILNVLLKRYFA